METLVLGHWHREPARQWGFINVSKAVGQAATEDAFLQRHPGVAPYETAYDASGPDTMHIQFDDVPQLIALLDDPKSPIRDAARKLNLRAMRKGPTVHGERTRQLWRIIFFKHGCTAMASVEDPWTDAGQVIP